MEADSGSVVQKVALRTDDIPLGEQTVAQVSKRKKRSPNTTKHTHERDLNIILTPLDNVERRRTGGKLLTFIFLINSAYT